MTTIEHHQFLVRRLKEIIDYYFNDQKVNLVDIGCADGSFMKLASKSLVNLDNVEGIDVPSNWLHESSVKEICNLYVQDLQHGLGEVPLNKYHIVTLWQVIEHIERPYAFLHNVSKIMNLNGVILLSSPNLSSFSRVIKGRKWIGTLDLTHKLLFDPLSLSMLLDRAGFCDVKVRSFFFPSFGESLDLANKVFSYLPGGGMLFAQAFKKAEP